MNGKQWSSSKIAEGRSANKCCALFACTEFTISPKVTTRSQLSSFENFTPIALEIPENPWFSKIVNRPLYLSRK